MIRLIALLVGLTILALIVAFFTDRPGEVQVRWLGYYIDTSVAAATASLVALLLLIALLTRISVWLVKETPFAPARRKERKTRKGYATLNRAMVALASGDEREARKLTRSAAKLLPPQPLTHIIGAEAARLTDDQGARKKHYEALADSGDAAFLGLRGLINMAREEGREKDALKLIGQAAEIRPQSRWVLVTRFDLQVKAGQWDEAAETLERAREVRAFDDKTLKRHGAVLDYCRAVEADVEGLPGQALTLSAAAHKAAPSLIPAAVLAAKLAAKDGDAKRGLKIVKTSYDVLPHPTLVDTDAQLMREATAHERLERARKLTDKRPDDPLSRITVAERALAADHVEDARKAIDPLVKERGDKQAFLLMAEIVERQHGPDDPDVVRWRNQAEAAESLPARWVCDHCASVRDTWTPVCPTCGTFDSYQWLPARAVTRQRLDQTATPLIEHS
ncbi:MAG: heme biosynthesis protein HemY [Rhodothalassiaceae bacterium]